MSHKYIGIQKCTCICIAIQVYIHKYIHIQMSTYTYIYKAGKQNMWIYSPARGEQQRREDEEREARQMLDKAIQKQEEEAWTTYIYVHIHTCLRVDVYVFNVYLHTGLAVLACV